MSAGNVEIQIQRRSSLSCRRYAVQEVPRVEAPAGGLYIFPICAIGETLMETLGELFEFGFASILVKEFELR